MTFWARQRHRIFTHMQGGTNNLKKVKAVLEVVKEFFEIGAEYCNGLWLATCIQAIAVLILALTVSRMR